VRVRRLLIAYLAFGLLAGCGSRQEPPAEHASEFAPIVSREAGIRFAPPIRWSRDRIVVTELGADSAVVKLAGAAHGVSFDYKAEQPGHRNQSLLCILVFDQTRWAAHLAEGGPPAGESIASVGDWVYVAALPSSNPYRAETLDADQFDDMHLSLEEVREAFAVEGNGPSLAKR
jgi:hypothetical protein